MKGKYKEIDGTFYHVDTPIEICNILNSYLHTKQRIRLFYGITETGEDWCDIYDTIGYVGRSCGSIKIPLLLNNARSIGGGGILDNCIVKITINKQVVYKHPLYHCHIAQENNVIYKKTGCELIRCNNEKTANRIVSFLLGNRNAH